MEGGSVRKRESISQRKHIADTNIYTQKEKEKEIVRNRKNMCDRKRKRKKESER